MDKFTIINGDPIKLIDNNDDTFSSQVVLDGIEATGVIPESGGSGAKGWLSSIFKAIKGIQGRKIQDATGVNTLVINSDGSINTRESGIPTAITGHIVLVTTSGTRVKLPNISCREVTVTALRNNVGFIFIGGSDVSSGVFGNDLASKESQTFMVSNVNQIYIDSSISGEGISYVAI